MTPDNLYLKDKDWEDAHRYATQVSNLAYYDAYEKYIKALCQISLETERQANSEGVSNDP